MLPVVATLMLIWAGTASDVSFSSWMAHPVLRFMGDNSYSWYLWHWPAIVLTALMWSDAKVALLIAGTLSLVPAVLSRRFMEEPIRRNQSIVGKKALGLAVICIGVPLAVAAVVYVGAGQRWGLDEPEGWDDIPVAREAGCHVNSIDDIKDWDADDCLFPADDAVGTILVLGDSHTSSHSTAVIEAGNALGYDVGVWSASGCPFIETVGPNLQQDECRDWVNQAEELVDELQPELVVIANRSTIYLRPQAGEPENPVARLADADGNQIETHEEGLELWGQGTTDTVASLEARGIAALVIGTNPEFWPDFIDEYSLARPDLEPFVTRTELEERQASVDAVMAAAIEDAERSAFLDPTATLCPGEICRPYDDGGWNYYDPDHLNGRGAALLVPEITSALEGLLP